ncbi:MAG: alpha-L-fucosidase [Candidatus Brocadiaceae bacterium]|nr:alpha-L-fucosidase [Candidatus Brocadiaceae bacterium]
MAKKAERTVGLDGMQTSRPPAAKPFADAAQKREERDRRRRMKWWHEARFGMLATYGLHSHLSMLSAEDMYWAKIPVRRYARLVCDFKPRPDAARLWAELAKKAGMKYMVFVSKHDDGYCLWDTKQSEFNSARTGPKRDIVRECVDACREAGLRVGLYFCLNDWRDPDCVRAATSKRARRRYLDFVQGCIRELMSNYGKIDVFWPDYPAALKTPELWESRKTIDMVRELQPDIIINNRLMLPEDFGTPEGHISAQNRAWESCMTLTGTGLWGWREEPEEDWASPRAIIEMIRQVTAGGGNLLLDFGPKPDGSPPENVEDRLLKVGEWLKGNEEAVYGKVDRVERSNFHPWLKYGRWTRKGKVAYFWCRHWRGRELVIVDQKTKVKRITVLKTGKPVRFTQEPGKLVLKGLPEREPDPIAHTTVFRIEFAGVPRRTSDGGYPLVWCGR